MSKSTRDSALPVIEQFKRFIHIAAQPRGVRQTRARKIITDSLAELLSDDEWARPEHNVRLLVGSVFLAYGTCAISEKQCTLLWDQIQTIGVGKRTNKTGT